MGRTNVSILPPLREIIPNFDRYQNTVSDLAEIINKVVNGEFVLDYMFPLEDCVASLTIEIMRNSLEEFELDYDYAYDTLRSYVDHEVQLALCRSHAEPSPMFLEQLITDIADEMISIYSQFFDKITKSYSLWNKLRFDNYNGVIIHDHKHLTAVVFSRTI